MFFIYHEKKTAKMDRKTAAESLKLKAEVVTKGIYLGYIIRLPMLPSYF